MTVLHKKHACLLTCSSTIRLTTDVDSFFMVLFHRWYSGVIYWRNKQICKTTATDRSISVKVWGYNTKTFNSLAFTVIESESKGSSMSNQSNTFPKKPWTLKSEIFWLAQDVKVQTERTICVWLRPRVYIATAGSFHPWLWSWTKWAD